MDDNEVAERRAFADFAQRMGLRAFPHPDGERYLCNLSGQVTHKKSEDVTFMDELWNALVRAGGGGDELLIRS